MYSHYTEFDKDKCVIEPHWLIKYTGCYLNLEFYSMKVTIKMTANISELIEDIGNEWSFPVRNMLLELLKELQAVKNRSKIRIAD